MHAYTLSLAGRKKTTRSFQKPNKSSPTTQKAVLTVPYLGDKGLLLEFKNLVIIRQNYKSVEFKLFSI